MEEIVKLSRSHFLASLGLMSLLVFVIGIWHYTSQPSLFIPPPDSEQKSLEEAISNSNDIEVLRKVCSTFARCSDRYRNYQNKFTEHLDELLIGILGAFVLLFGSFTYGYFKIYKIAKRVTNENPNAL